MVELALATLDIVAIDCAWRGVVCHRIVDLLILSLAVKTTYRADNRQLDLTNELTLAVVLINFVLCVDKVLGKEVVARHTYRLEQRLALGDDVVLLACEEIYTHKAIVRCIVVGHNQNLVLVAVEHHIVVVKALVEGVPLTLRGALVEQLRTRSTCRRGDKLPLAILALATVVVVEWVFLILEDEDVLLLLGAEAVEIDLLVGVLSRIYRIALLRSIVCAIVEATTVTSPRCAREFHPLDVVGEWLHSLGVEHLNLHPIRARRGESISEIFAILRERACVQRHSAILREGIRVEEELLLGVREVALAVEYALVLESAVA